MPQQHAVAADPEVLVLLSGGVDSAACVAFCLEVGRPTCGLFVDYQQPALKKEAASARHIADYFGIPLHRARWVGPRTKEVGLIPARNAVLLSAALMERPPTATAIAIGIHAGTPYVDCSPEFVSRMQRVYDLYFGSRVQIVAPFLEWAKSEIWSYARSKAIPFELTYSCEAGSEQPCGECASCLDRKLLGD
jgi:7-cyano-7-deazaguanine synthase